MYTPWIKSMKSEQTSTAPRARKALSGTQTHANTPPPELPSTDRTLTQKS